MSCGCPQNYIFNETTGLCERTVQTPAELNSEPILTLPMCGSIDNLINGTLIFTIINKNQYPLIGITSINPSFEDGLGNIIIPSLNLVYGNLWISNGDLARGRLNQAGINLLAPINQWQGYSRCITIEEGDQISIALSATYGFRLFIDGELAIYYVSQYPVRTSNNLYVFPLNLSEGNHNLLFEGLSGSTNAQCFDKNGLIVNCSNLSAVLPDVDCNFIGSFVAEIYKNVNGQILANITDQDALNNVYAKHSVNGVQESITTLLLRGSPTDTGVHGNYYCSSGYLTNCIPGKFYCIENISVSPGVCCFILTNCVTGIVKYTNSDLTTYLGKVIKVSEFSGCYIINTYTACPGEAVPVTVINSYNTCPECEEIFYNLVDCKGQVTNLVTIFNMNQYVGKIVKIEGYQNVCWIVTYGDASESLIIPEILEYFNTCEQCL